MERSDAHLSVGEEKNQVLPLIRNIAVLPRRMGRTGKIDRMGRTGRMGRMGRVGRMGRMGRMEEAGKWAERAEKAGWERMGVDGTVLLQECTLMCVALQCTAVNGLH